jgi:hypothetical protein
MTASDALLAVAADWVEVSPGLYNRELEEITKGLTAMREQGLDRTSEDFERWAFDILRRALPPDHPAIPLGFTRRHERIVVDASFDPDGALGVLLDLASRTLAERSGVEASLDDLEQRGMAELLERVDLVPWRYGDALRASFVLADRGVGTVVPKFFLKDGFLQMPELEVRDDIVEINEQLGARQDPLGALGWWLNPNGWLGDTPANAVAVGRADEVLAAAAELANDSW